jgi:hypothetical protein
MGGVFNFASLLTDGVGSLSKEAGVETGEIANGMSNSWTLDLQRFAGGTDSTGGITKKFADEIGEYGDIGGHHVHAKAAFKNIIQYDPKKGFSVSQKLMSDMDWDHQAMTKTQRQLFKELAESGRTNTLAEQSRIAEEALIAGGASPTDAKILVELSLDNLAQQGVTVPSNIPWYK